MTLSVVPQGTIEVESTFNKRVLTSKGGSYRIKMIRAIEIADTTTVSLNHTNQQVFIAYLQVVGSFM